ncbi:MAG TPA: HNH endonuclease, partial [bacterium]
MPYIPAVLRAKFRRKFHDAYAYCRSPEHLMGVIFEIDHIIPLVEGGATHEDNLCLC